MNKRFATEAQRLSFECDGFLLVEDALEGEQLSRIRAAAQRAEALWSANSSRPGLRKENLLQVQAVMEYEDELAALLWHPKIFPMVWNLLGDDVAMIEHDLSITPPNTRTHALWHHGVGQRGVFHPLSTLMIRVFYLLSDVGPDGGGTLLIPGSHKFPTDYVYPAVDDPGQMPGSVQMCGKAGSAYLFHGRIYHAAAHNSSETPRRVLAFTYGHSWMHTWKGHEPSEALKAKADTTVKQQLLHLRDPYCSGLSLKDWLEHCEHEKSR